MTTLNNDLQGHEGQFYREKGKRLQVRGLGERAKTETLKNRL